MAAVGDVRNAASKFQRIPAKWKDYSVCGKVIPAERLVSFKTPLSEQYHFNGKESDPEDCLQKDEQFTPKDLCDIFRKRDYILGLVVDFTNTKRYYQAQEFTDRKIEYKKIKCEGKIVPPDKVVNRFKATILSFFKKFPNSASLVGVHCTHGLNRAGYIVCRYLIECRGYSPKEAIEAFNKARGHKMERENYLEDLEQRKPKKLSEHDIDRLIETAPRSDEECQPDGNWKRDYRNGPPQRRDTRAPYRHARPEPRGPPGDKRGYRGRFQDRHAEYEDYDRVDGRRYVRDNCRYESNEPYERGVRYDMDPYMDIMEDERSLRYHERHIHETDRRGDRRYGRDYLGHERGHEIDRGRYDVDRGRYDAGRGRYDAGRGRYDTGRGRYDVDPWDDERSRGPHFRGPPRNEGNNRSYEKPHYRERDDRNPSRMRGGDYR